MSGEEWPQTIKTWLCSCKSMSRCLASGFADGVSSLSQQASAAPGRVSPISRGAMGAVLHYHNSNTWETEGPWRVSKRPHQGFQNKIKLWVYLLWLLHSMVLYLFIGIWALWSISSSSSWDYCWFWDSFTKFVGSEKPIEECCHLHCSSLYRPHLGVRKPVNLYHTSPTPFLVCKVT